MAVSSLTSGTVLGHYRLGALIGRGGMGEVYEAHDLTLERRVALKILPPELFNRPDRIRLFVQEAKSASALNHPHILTVHEIGEGSVDGVPIHYIATELVEGSTLRDEIYVRRTPLKRLLTTFIEVADALTKAHASGIVHRDLKPDNIMLTAEGYAKVIDFGLATLAESPIMIRAGDPAAPSITPTRERGLYGTIGYMAPEQVEQQPTDQRSDIFSFGCILYEAITRTRAFDARTDVEVLYKIRHDAPAPLDTVVPDVPEELQQIVERCLEKAPGDRYQSIRDMALDLRDVGQRLSAESRPVRGTPTTPQAAPVRRKRIPPAVWWGVAGALALAVGLAAVMMSRRPRVEGAPTMRALARWPSDETNCRISPDGVWVSFLSNRQGTPAIWLRRNKGGEPALLISREAEIVSHVWSPQSDQIAYLTVGPDERFLQLVPAFGGPSPDSIALDNRFRNGARLIRWIGRNIYAESSEGLWRMDTSTRRISKLTEVRGKEGRRTDFDVRSDEEKITYSVNQDDRATVWVANLDGSEAVSVTDDERRYSDYGSHFAGPGDDELILSSDRSGQVDLWRVSFGRRMARQITFSPTTERVDDISADGRTIAFREDRNYANLWSTDIGTGESRQLTAEALQDLSPSASEGGLAVAFQRTKPTIERATPVLDANIFVAPLSSGQMGDPRLIVSDAALPRLAPKGQWLTYVKPAKARQFDLWLKDLRSEHQWRITNRFKLPSLYDLPVDWVESNLAWSSLDDLYFVERAQAGRQQIRRATPMTQEVVTVVEGGKDVDLKDLFLSGDGRLLAYIRKSGATPASTEVVVRDLSMAREKVFFSRTHDWHERITCRGWRRNGELVILSGTINPDWTERLQAILVAADGRQTVTPVAARGFGGTARIEPSSDSLILTIVDSGGFHNLSLVSLVGGGERRLTSNRLTGISFAGIEVLPQKRIVFSREEANSDLWLIDFPVE